MTKIFNITDETSFEDLRDAFRAASLEIAERLFEDTIIVADLPEAKPLRVRKVNKDLYFITGFNSQQTSPELISVFRAINDTPPEDFIGGSGYTSIVFQHGQSPEQGRNGVTIEALTTVLIDRLKSFQDTGFACGENAEAIYHLEKALEALDTRRLRRIADGTAGSQVPEINDDSSERGSDDAA